MAQVSMTGIEYKNLIRKEDQLNELINYLCAQRKVTVPASSCGAYSCGEWHSHAIMPMWLQDMYVTAMLSQLILLPEEEFLNMVKGGYRYYNVEESSLNNHHWGNGSVDLLDASPDFRRMWEEVEEKLHGKEEEEDA